MRRLDQIRLSDTDRRAIQAAAAALREHLPVDQVILYGSKARGDDDDESDIDLLVLTSRPLTPDEDRSVVSLLFPLQLEFDVMLSSVEIPRDEWDHGVYQVMPLRYEVERDGVAV